MKSNALTILGFILMGLGSLVLVYEIIGDFAGHSSSGIIILAIGAVVFVFGKSAMRKYA